MAPSTLRELLESSLAISDESDRELLAASYSKAVADVHGDLRTLAPHARAAWGDAEVAALGACMREVHCPHMTSLDLSGCAGLTHAESLEWLGDLPSLVLVDVGNCRLGALPDSVGRLGNLHTLQLRGNPLSMLPDSLADLTALEIVQFDATDALAYLPDLSRRPNLRVNGVRLGGGRGAGSPPGGKGRGGGANRAGAAALAAWEEGGRVRWEKEPEEEEEENEAFWAAMRDM